MTAIVSLLGLIAAASMSADDQALEANCILDRLTVEQAQGVAPQGGIFIDTGAMAPETSLLLTPTPICAELHQWTRTQTEVAVRFTIAKLALPSAIVAMERRGMNPAKLEAIYRELPAETLARALTRADVGAMGVKAEAAGLLRTDEEYTIFGRYVGFLNMIDLAPAMLACAEANPPTAENPSPASICATA